MISLWSLQAYLKSLGHQVTRKQWKGLTNPDAILYMYGLETLAHSLQTFFAVFCAYQEWGWNALPDSYRSSPYLTADIEATQTYFNATASSTLQPEEPSLPPTPLDPGQPCHPFQQTPTQQTSISHSHLQLLPKTVSLKN